MQNAVMLRHISPVLRKAVNISRISGNQRCMYNGDITDVFVVTCRYHLPWSRPRVKCELRKCEWVFCELKSELA